MGLTRQSAGARDPSPLSFPSADVTVALAGNPNVGKSTVFNALTGMNQHTGNWPGKTVAGARGSYSAEGRTFAVIDTPGTYSLSARSAEEEVARDYICFGDSDLTVLVLDATGLERNLPLALQILARKPRAVVCLNLMDEARKKKIRIDTDELALQLGVPVVVTAARAGEGLAELKRTVAAVAEGTLPCREIRRTFDEETEAAVENLEAVFRDKDTRDLPPRWLALCALKNDEGLNRSIHGYLGRNLLEEPDVRMVLAHLLSDTVPNRIAEQTVLEAERIARLCVVPEDRAYAEKDRKIDRILTSKKTGIPLMLLLLGFVFWLTVVGANGISDVLSAALFSLEEPLHSLLLRLCAPPWLCDAVVSGVWRTLAWVVSVMLPPMAIFFPLFTLLEDVGVLPRIAFCCDGTFRRVGAHGKQALTMCMGFGCNACGVIGCRIIDSPRERLIAILTNSFVPCNGRFPALISLISLFCVFRMSGILRSVATAGILLLLILLSVLITLGVSRLLSATVLRGEPSGFLLELPPYRMPKIGEVLVRSVFDRTLFVLGRAAAVAAPAGLLIWALSFFRAGDATLLSHLTAFLNPVGRFFGMDGVILTAFLLGLPANETVIPLMMMAYLGESRLTELTGNEALGSILLQNGWTTATAICVVLFFLFHFPCATTLKTIYRETGSGAKTLLSAVLPTAVGLVLCLLTRLIFSAFG